MAGIKYGGIDIPYTKVKAEYTRNPAEFIYTSTPRYFGGARIRGIRPDFIGDSIEVVIDRRGTNKSWDQIKSEIHAIILMNTLPRFKPLAFEFEGEDKDKFYLAKITKINYSPEREYTMDAVISFVTEFPYRFGEERTINITTTKAGHTILGQEAPHWKVISTFTANKANYEFEADGGIVKITYPFQAGDVLEINYIEREILLNGADKTVALNLETVWPRIMPGPDSFRASNASKLIYNELYY